MYNHYPTVNGKRPINLRQSRPFGVEDRPPCPSCGSEMNLFRRSPEPVHHGYEVQMFSCMECDAEFIRSTDRTGKPHPTQYRSPSRCHRAPAAQRLGAFYSLRLRLAHQDLVPFRSWYPEFLSGRFNSPFLVFSLDDTEVLVLGTKLHTPTIHVFFSPRRWEAGRRDQKRPPPGRRMLPGRLPTRIQFR